MAPSAPPPKPPTPASAKAPAAGSGAGAGKKPAGLAQVRANVKDRRAVVIQIPASGKPPPPPAKVPLSTRAVTPALDRAGQIFIQCLYMVPVVGNAMALYDVGVDVYRLYQGYSSKKNMGLLDQIELWAILAIDALGVIPGEGQATSALRGGLKELVLKFIGDAGKQVAVDLLWDALGGDAMKYLSGLAGRLEHDLQPKLLRTLDTVVDHVEGFVRNPMSVESQASRLKDKKGFWDWMPSKEHIVLYGVDQLLKHTGLQQEIPVVLEEFRRGAKSAIGDLIGTAHKAGRLLVVAQEIGTAVQQLLEKKNHGLALLGPRKKALPAPGHETHQTHQSRDTHPPHDTHQTPPPEAAPGKSTHGAYSHQAQVPTGAQHVQQHAKGGPHRQNVQKDAHPEETPAHGTCGWPRAKSTPSVDFATGDENLEQADFRVPGVVPLTWTRLYRSSLAAYDGSALGARWSSAYHLSLVEETPGELVFHDEENRAVKLPPVKAGERAADAREKMEIVRPDDAHVELHYPGGIREQYEHHRTHGAARHYRLVSRTGRDGLGHWLGYGETGQLLRIEDGHGLHVGLEYAGAHVAAIHRLDVAGTIQETLARYTYSAQGDLLTHTNPAGHTRTYAYGQHLLEHYTDYSGFATHLRWDWPGREAGEPAPSNARVIHEWRSPAGRENERYDESHFMYRRSRCYTKVTDAQGNETYYRYDLNNQIIVIEPAEGGTQYFLWDRKANLVQTLDASGRSEYMEYDDAGRLISHTDAMGQTTRTEYDAQGLPVAQILPAGGVIKTVHDAQGRPVSVTDAAGRITQYQWNAHSRLAALTDPKGGTRSYTWDARGLLASATDCSGRQTQYQYDTRGHLSRRIDALGQTTQYRHDVLGQPETITQADGSTHRFEHDAQGNLRTYTNAAGQTTHWHYNGQGLPTWREDAAGRTLSYRYDGNWRLTVLRNENDQAMRFVYDAMGQCVEETGFDGKVSQFAYDAAGNQVESLVGGVHTQRWYDGLGRLRKRESRADTGPVVKEEYFYDSHGRLTTARNAEGSKVRFHYDEAGNLIAEEQHSYVDYREYISVTRHAYDALGNRVRTMLPNTRMVDWLRYGSGHVHGVMLDQKPLLDLERDALHRETARQHAKFTQQRSYDALGRLTKLEASSQNQRLASRQMTWNRAGHLERIADAARGDTRYAYDPTGRLLEAIAPDLKELFAFDPAGNPVDPEKIRPYPTDVETPQERAERHAREAAERAAWNAAHPEQERFSPMDERRLDDDRKISAWKASLPKCLANMLEEYCRTRYEHDERGNLTSRTPWHGPQWRYEWDAANRLKAAYRHDRRNPGSTDNPDLAIRFSYDAFGRRTLKEARYPDGRIERTVFTWDGSTLLLEERFEQPVMTREERIAERMRHPAPLKVFCEYPPDSDPLPVAQRQHQLNTEQWRGMSMYLYEPDTFVPLARLEQTLEEPAHISLGPDGEFIEHPARSSHATYFYQNDHLGTPQELVDEDGEIVWLGKYRAWGELRSASQKNGQPAKIRNALRFQGQYCDDETGLHYNLNRYYDPQAGRFINRDPIGLDGGINLFSYASNPVQWTDPLGLAKTTATGGSGNQYISGMNPVPGYSNVSPEDVGNMGNQIGWTPKAAGAFDRGKKGSYYCSHAEPKALTAGEQSMTVDNEMCPSCQDFAGKYAKYSGGSVTIADPSTVRTFGADGTITQVPIGKK